MILVIFVFCIAMSVVGVILDRHQMYGVGTICEVFGIAGCIIAAIAGIILGICVSELSIIDERIAMYEEENAQIEQQIADVVEQYQKYETDIFMEVAPESAVSMVALYPELKSDSLVQTQIEVYVENNGTIKALKDDQIVGDVYRWWVYFGSSKED